MWERARGASSFARLHSLVIFIECVGRLCWKVDYCYCWKVSFLLPSVRLRLYLLKLYAVSYSWWGSLYCFRYSWASLYDAIPPDSHEPRAPSFRYLPPSGGVGESRLAGDGVTVAVTATSGTYGSNYLKPLQRTPCARVQSLVSVPSAASLGAPGSLDRNDTWNVKTWLFNPILKWTDKRASQSPSWCKPCTESAC